MQKKIIGLKIRIKKREKKGKLHRTAKAQCKGRGYKKPNVKAEVYNNKKCD